MLSSIDFLSDKFKIDKLISEFEDEDTSIEEEEVLETDKMIVATFPADESNSMLFYVYSSDYFYPHHEINYPTVFFDCKVLKNDFVAVSSLLNDILVFDPKIKHVDGPSYILQGHDSNVLCLEMQEDLISGSEDKTIIFWDNDKPKEKVECGDDIIKLSVEGNLIAYSSNSKVVLREINKKITDFDVKDVEDIKLRNNNLYLSDGEGNIIIYDLRNYEKSLYKLHDEFINSFDFYKNYLVTGSEDRRIKFFDLCQLETIKEVKVNEIITRLKFNEDICFYGGEITELNYLDANKALLK